MSGKSWAFVVISGRRQYAGNAGYEDDPARIYKYDSAVPNSRNVSEGDLVALRDRDHVLGIGRVARIVSYPGEKERFRCPVCRTTAIKARSRMTPRFRCQKGHLFDVPDSETVAVTKYEAHYRDDFLELNGEVSAAMLRSTAFRPSTQNSIEEIDADILAGHVIAKRPDAAILFERFYQRFEEEPADGGDDKTPYTPSSGDRRQRILREISARKGQARFRRKLFERYGAQCMISGCTLMDVIEAAHIWPYRGDEDNDPGNGLLLKSDLHTLYDLDLLGIAPSSLKITIPPSLASSDYAALHGRSLIVTKNRRPSHEALARRWQAFCEKHGMPDQEA